jgi:hypothetical protein
VMTKLSELFPVSSRKMALLPPGLFNAVR